MIGSLAIHVRDIIKIKEIQHKSYKLVDHNTGKHNGEVLFEIEVKKPLQALMTDEHSVYEYQRWKPVVFHTTPIHEADHWMHDPPSRHKSSNTQENIESNDIISFPESSRWSTVDGFRFGDSPEDLYKLESGWKVKRQW